MRRGRNNARPADGTEEREGGFSLIPLSGEFLANGHGADPSLELLQFALLLLLHGQLGLGARRPPEGGGHRERRRRRRFWHLQEGVSKCIKLPRVER